MLVASRKSRAGDVARLLEHHNKTGAPKDARIFCYSGFRRGPAPTLRHEPPSESQNWMLELTTILSCEPIRQARIVSM